MRGLSPGPDAGKSKVAGPLGSTPFPRDRFRMRSGRLNGTSRVFSGCSDSPYFSNRFGSTSSNNQVGDWNLTARSRNTYSWRRTFSGLVQARGAIPFYGDVFGDWREEALLESTDHAELRSCALLNWAGSEKTI